MWIYVSAFMFMAIIILLLIVLIIAQKKRKLYIEFEDCHSKMKDMELKLNSSISKEEYEKEKEQHKRDIDWLRAVLDAIDAPISVTNNDMEWTFINKVVEQQLGVKRSDIIGKKCCNWGANICNTENCGINRLKKGKNISYFSQGNKHFQVNVSHLINKDGEVLGYVEVVKDITVVVNKSKEFEKLAYWYESILDSIPFPISVTDTDKKWTFVNKATENILGTNREQLVGKQCSNWSANICNTTNCGIECAKRGVSETKFDSDGSHFKVDISLLKDIDGNNAGYVEVVQDITRIEELIGKLNDILSQISIASDQVTSGATQVSSNGQELAHAAQTQTLAIDSLNESVSIINERIKNSVENASTASKLSSKSKQNAVEGNEEMKMMLAAMEDIRDSSNNISTIIKTIEDISVQTNLLALNAAVEAARAGVHGKGFSIVAEEVRNLAGRSQVAAKETNELIIHSIESVEKGTEIAKSTANHLDIIVSDFENVSKIIDEIAVASTEQFNSINDISSKISQISTIVVQNAATSEDAAAASQELSSQAELLRSLTKKFNS